MNMSAAWHAGAVDLPEFIYAKSRVPQSVKAWIGNSGIDAVFDIFTSAYECPAWHEFRRRTSRPITKQELFERNGKGKTYLDNPYNWEQMTSWLQDLYEEGERLTLADLRQVNHEGRTFLEQAARSGQLPHVMKLLSANGETLEKSDLLDQQGQANGTLKAAASWQHLNSIFTYDQWKEKPFEDFSRVLRALPAPVHEHIKNRHSLLAVLKREDTQRHTAEGRERIA